MGLLEKVTEFLLKKNWVVILISFVSGLIVSIYIPSDFYNKLPFSNRDVSVIIAFSVLVILIFLVLSLLIYIFQKISNHSHKKAQTAKMNAHNKNEMEQAIDDFKCTCDAMSDYDFNIIMQLVESGNQKPLVLRGYTSSNILHIDKWFYIVESQEPLKVIPSNSKRIDVVSISIPLTQTVQKIKLKPEAYDFFKYIIETTGDLSHMPKNRFPVGEQEDE